MNGDAPQTRCPVCGSALDPDDEFCEACGSNAPPPAEGKVPDYSAGFERSYRLTAAWMWFIMSLVAGAATVSLVVGAMTEIGPKNAALAFAACVAAAASAEFFVAAHLRCPGCDASVLLDLHGWPFRRTDFVNCPGCGAKLRR